MQGTKTSQDFSNGGLWGQVARVGGDPSRLEGWLFQRKTKEEAPISRKPSDKGKRPQDE